jgi:hypothetical protein
VTVAAALVQLWHYSQTQQWRFPDQALTFFAAWILLLLAYRWRVLRKREMAGSFLEERHRNDPLALFGPLKSQLLWFGSGVLIILVWDFCRIFVPLMLR